MNGPTSEQEKIIWQAVTSLCLLFIVALGLMIFVLFLQGLLFLSSVLVPLAIAAVIAYLLHPVICWLERRGMKRTPAIILLFISTTVTLAIISAILVPKLYTETSGLIRDLPQMKDSLLEKSRSWLDANPDIAAQVPKIEEHLQAELPKYNAQIASWVWTGVGGFFSTLGLLLGLVFIPLYVFYLLRDQPSIESSWHDYVPLQRSWLRDEIVIIISEINKHMITFFRGQVIIAVILGILTGIGLSIIGLKYALVIGVISALFSIIPYLGVILSVLPALLIAIAQSSGSPTFIALTLGVFVIVQLCEGNFISPKIMGDRTGLHPLTIIVSILIWSIILGGLLGAILAIPLTATLKVLMYRYIWKRDPHFHLLEEKSADIG
ncbi:MAG: AI-2E family transporter [Candidatus Methylacidiphilales bacterium]